MFFVLFLMGACNSGNKTKSTEKTTVKQPVTPKKEAVGATLPSVPSTIVKELWEKCDMVDFMYYDLPVSMSMDNKGGIQYAIRFIAGESPKLNPACQSIGQISYQIQGEEKLLADIYFNKGCTYFVFVDSKGKQLYANEMTNDAISFFNQAVSNVKTKK